LEAPFQLSKWHTLLRRHGRGVLANRHMQAAWRAVATQSLGGSTYVTPTEAMLAENDLSYRWVQSGAEGSVTLSVNALDFYNGFLPGTRPPFTTASDPANWPHQVPLTLSANESQDHLTPH